MRTRREFLFGSWAAMVALADRDGFCANRIKPLGVQLYTVRRQAEKDLAAVLKEIQAIGYTEVEPYWNIYDHPAKQLRTLLSDHGLSAPSGHFDYEGFDTKFDYAQQLGVRYMICPKLPESMRNLDGFKKAADQFNDWGAKIDARGMRLGFHNHNYEFEPLAGGNGFDTLLARTDPKLVIFEMDCYWITQAGRDPVEMINQHAGRIRMLHLKDRKPGFATTQKLDKSAEHFTEVGNGTLDWKAILGAAQGNHIQHLFVEQDESERPPLESLRISYSYLSKLL